MVFRIFLLSMPYVLVCSAFLLDTNNLPNGQTVAPGYYLTVNGFLEAQKQQHRENEALHQTTEALHQTMDKTLALLTLQIQDKFSKLEQKLQDSTKDNETRLSVELLERKYRELEDNYTRMQHLVIDLQKQNADKENELVLLRNSTSELDTRIRHVEQLKSFQQLTELETLKHELQVINDQTGSLRSNELARNQDFLALYNETLALKRRTSEIEVKSDNFRNQTVVKLKNLENVQNTSFKELHSEIDRTRMEAELYDNKTLQELKKLSTEINEQVAITSCTSVLGPVSSGYVIPFDDVKSVVGVNGVSSFKANGKFTCEKEGLYHVSASVMSYTTGVFFNIKVNGNIYSQASLDISGGLYRRATAVTTAVLKVKDTVWVEASSIMFLHGAGSYCCLTIVNVK